MKTNVKLPSEEKQNGIEPAAIQEQEPETKNGNGKVHLDFSSPFQKAVSLKKRLKLFLWGDTGVGKTVLSLQFPKPVIIDLEGGADLYGDSFKFDVLRANDPDEVMAALDWLLKNKHFHRTLIIDPVTVYWDMLQKKWSDIFMLRNKGTKGFKHEFYDLQVKDWMTIKNEFKEFIRKLIALDMNVIVTAREKTKYKEGSFMVAIGETFDGEKSLPYAFDTIVRMYINGEGKHMGCVIKDRSNNLPQGEFEISYELIEKAFGKKDLGREAKHQEMISTEQKAIIEGFLKQFKLTPELIAKRLAAYEAQSVDDLTFENANVIIKKFEDAFNAPKKSKKEKK